MALFPMFNKPSAPFVTNKVVLKEPTTVIKKLQDIPKGILLSGSGGVLALSEDRQIDFACIASPTNSIVILVSVEAYGKAAMFDMKNRVTTAGYRVSLPFVATTRDVIHLCYAELKSSLLDLNVNSTDIEVLTWEIIDGAHERGASDIHIETRGPQADIYFRINGVRSFHSNISKETALSMGSVLYTVHADAGSKSVTWNPSGVSDGAIMRHTKKGTQLQLRFSSSPIYPNGNFHIVIRVLCMETSLQQLDKLGYTEEQLGVMDAMSAGSNGMVLVCGPTGSGKSTSLQSLLANVYLKRGREIKIITVEDPVEYIIPGACQIPVPRDRSSLKDEFSGSVFTTFLKGTLRQDPDVVMVGEIRDNETVSVTKDLVLAGRKVFATLHTYSALWAFVRLREIGLSWEVLTMPGFIAGIIYQRLLPKLCSYCSVPVGEADISEDIMLRLSHVVDLVASNVRCRGAGCPECGHSGIIGRTVISEFVVPERRLLQLLSENKFMDAEAHWKRISASYVTTDSSTGGAATVLADAISKMKLGLVSPIDIENQLALLTSELVIDEIGFK